MSSSPKIEESQVFELVLGKVVATLRSKRGWTQRQLADRLAVSQSMVSRMENGTAAPSAYQFGRLASAFGITVEQLNQHVVQATEATKRAAQAVKGQPADEAMRLVGLVGVIGLIIFAVAALLGGDEGPPSK